MEIAQRTLDNGTEIYRYDAFNRLSTYYSGSTIASYTYYADNLRASKKVNGSAKSFTWNGQNLAAETDASGTNVYTYDMTGIHISNMNGEVKGYLKDTHGNVVALTEANGTLAEDALDYTAFGENLKDTPNPFGYCGEYYDSENGLIYLRNRYYDSSIGGFITEDPIRDGLNWYVYCANDPVNKIDTIGLYYQWIRDVYAEYSIYSSTNSNGNLTVTVKRGAS